MEQISQTIATSIKMTHSSGLPEDTKIEIQAAVDAAIENAPKEFSRKLHQFGTACICKVSVIEKVGGKVTGTCTTSGIEPVRGNQSCVQYAHLGA